MSQSFAELVESRKNWINSVLIPWCQSATRSQLRLAELEWTDIAGKVAPEKTLWFWAWNRFPQLVQPELQGIDETHPVKVTLQNGTELAGHPDARESTQGELVLIGKGASGRLETFAPIAIDDIHSVQRL